MNLQLQMQNSNDGTVYDISNLAEPIQIKKSIDGTAGELTCILQKDPNQQLQISNGSKIWFTVDGQGVFYGYIFTIGVDSEGNYKIKAYDQLRYLKNSDVFTYSNMTASDIFADLCKKFNLKYYIKTPTKFIPPPRVYNQTDSLYSIIAKGMHLASINDHKLYYIIDNYGTIVWSEFGVEGSKITIDLNEYSGITSYTYEKSIDNDTYTRIKLYRDNKDTNKVDTWTEYDSNSETKWGILQLLQQVNDENMNSAQIKEQAKKLLTAKNREVETLKLQGEGIIECMAGKRVRFKIGSENFDKYMWIKSSTHTFSKYEHTMDLEVVI